MRHWNRCGSWASTMLPTHQTEVRLWARGARTVCRDATCTYIYICLFIHIYIMHIRRMFVCISIYIYTERNEHTYLSKQVITANICAVIRKGPEKPGTLPANLVDRVPRSCRHTTEVQRCAHHCVWLGKVRGPSETPLKILEGQLGAVVRSCLYCLMT